MKTYYMKKQSILISMLVLFVSCSTIRNIPSSPQKTATHNSSSSSPGGSIASLVADSNTNAAVDTAYVRKKLPVCFMDALTKFGLTAPDILQYFSKYNNSRCNKRFFDGVDEIIKTNHYNLVDCDVYALWGYTTNLFYKDLNGWLRADTNASKTEYITREMVNALNKLPNYEGKILYRGITIPASDLQDFLKGYKAGSENTWTSFTSCGGTESGSFAGRPIINVIFVIEHQTGKDISVFADGIRCGVPPNTPPEILIKPNCTFVSTVNPSFDPTEKKWMIHLKQIR
jgi:hypothetical protein